MEEKNLKNQQNLKQKLEILKEMCRDRKKSQYFKFSKVGIFEVKSSRTYSNLYFLICIS